MERVGQDGSAQAGWADRMEPRELNGVAGVRMEQRPAPSIDLLHKRGT